MNGWMDEYKPTCRIVMASDLKEMHDSLYCIYSYDDAMVVLSEGQTDQLRICAKLISFFKMMQA